MDLPKSEIAYINKIGTLDTDPVYEVRGKGGITYVVVQKAKGGTEMLSMGSHPGVAKYAARKRKPTLVLNELFKSEPIYEQFSHENDAFVDFFNAKYAK